ncbi:MAG: endonuclease/exonuclease/phosphatase family protein [Kiritimatiellae bacterium]|nr:endonuclease/exonuclease/phosphatase family protein [Kiritimatiellia bacterium]
MNFKNLFCIASSFLSVFLFAEEAKTSTPTEPVSKEVVAEAAPVAEKSVAAPEAASEAEKEETVTDKDKKVVSPFIPWENQVKVCTWNMRWFPSGSPVVKPAKDEYKRSESAARFLNWQKVDIVMLQEVRSAEVVTNLIKMMERPGMKVAACTQFPTLPTDPVPQHQNAIITHYPVIDSGFAKWEKDGELEPPRGYAYAVIDCEGTLILCFSVHFKSNFIAKEEDSVKTPIINRQTREATARQFVAIADTLSKKEYDGRKIEAVFLAGDFNTSIFDENFKGEKTIQTIIDGGYRDVYADVPADQRETMPATKWHSSTVFDYIFYKGDKKLNDPYVAPKSWISDHRLVSIKFIKK